MPNPWEMTYATDPGKQPWEQAWPAAKKLSIEEEASQAAGIPIKGVQPPKAKMEQTPGATGLSIINEQVVRPAKSIETGFYKGVSRAGKMVSNLADLGARMSGNPYMSAPVVEPTKADPGAAVRAAGPSWRDEIADDASREGKIGVRGATTYHVAGTENTNPYQHLEGKYQGEAEKLKGQGATGLAGQLYEAGGQAIPDLAKYTAATALFGGPLGMAAVDAATEYDKGGVAALTAGAKGALLGKLGHVMAPARRATRMLGMGTAMGAETAIGGGSPTEIMASAITGAGMAAPGGKGTSFKNARLGEQRANIELEQLRREHAAQAERPGDYFGTRETAPNEQPVEIMPPSVPKTEQPTAPPAKSRKEQLLERYGDRTKAAQDAAYQQGYADVHPEDSTRLPWEYSWQARPDTALPATPIKSAKESAEVFEAPRSAKESADVFRRELNQKPRVPETGDPFERRRDTQERMAQQLGGKPWEQLSPAEQQQVNAWIDEGYHGEVIPPQVQAPTPKPAPAPKPMFQQDQRVLGKQEQAARLKEEADAFQQGYRDVHPEDTTRLPWEESWQARPDTAKPATPLKSAEESAKVFEQEPPKGSGGVTPEARVTVEDLVPAPRPSSPELPRKEVIQSAPVAGAVQAAPAHEFASTQANLYGPVADKVKQESLKIPDSVLAEDGRESQPHVTVKYGLHDDSPAAIAKVQEALAGVPPIRVMLGETSIFPAKDASGSDVVKANVESPELHSLNKVIADALPHTDTHPTYQPHVTLAYVKAGEGRKFAGNKALEGQEIVLDHISFSKRDGSQVDIPLGGRRELQRTISDPKEMRIPIEDLHVDPQRFQYKMDAYLKGGVTDEYKGVTKYDRDKAGTIAVWRDPADGKTYVVNGHHRYEMASRLGEDSMAVRYVDAANPAEARLKGALINIGDGKGTAIDAAKVFRDSGLTPEELANSGISLKGKVAEDGMALSKLTGVLFDDVVRGGLTHRQGAIIGKGNLSESAQLAVAKFMASHPNMREGALEEVVRRAGKSGTKTVEQESLFGTNEYEENLFNEEAHLVADIKARLGQEKRLFGAVGNQSAASRLAGAGNKIEAERNAQIAGEAGEALGAFDALQDKSGPIADAIAQAAREVADGKPRKAAADRLYDVVRAEVSKALRREEGGLFAEPGGGVADGPAEASGQPRVSQRRLDSQGGFLTIPGKQPPTPLDPADAAAQAWDAKREAARKGPLKTIRDRINQFRKDFATGLTPILDAFEASQKAGAKIPWKDNWNNAAARSVKAREEAERFVRDQGLQDVLRAPDNYEMFNNFLIAQEVRREASAENRATGVDLAEANAIYNKYANKPVNESGLTYSSLSQQVSGYADKLLAYSTNAGIISQSLATQLRKQYGAFIPLARVHAALEAGGAHIGSKSIASLSKQSVYQKRVGSEAAIEYPIETLLERTRAAFMQGEKNKAAALLASFEKKPVMSQFMREVPAHELAKVGMPAHSFSYLRDGKKVVVETTQEWEAALKGLDKETLGTLAKILAAPVRVMKFGTTSINLAFAAANPFRDWGSILINSKEWKDTALNPVVFWESTKAALIHDANWGRIEREGAGFTSLDLFRDTMQKTAEHMRATRSGKDFAKFAFKHPITTAAGLTRALEDIGQRTEQLDRARLALGTERANLRRGMDPENALAAGVYAANNELPAYHMSGNAIAGLKGAVLYLNARIQGIRSFASAMQDRPVSTMSKVVVGLYTPVALLTIANMSTPLGRQVSADMEEWDKEGNLFWVSPWAKKNERTGRWEGVMKIPLSPDLGSLATPVRRLIEQQMGGKKVDALKDVARPLAGSVLPFDPTPRGAIVGLAPHVVKAPFEYLANYDTFRDKPTVSQPMQDLPVEEQYRPNTSGTVRKVAGVLNASPLKVEQFVKNVVGGVTPQLLNTADWVASKAGLIKENEVGGETLPSAVAKRFTSAAGGAQENSYYSLRREAQEKMSRYYIGLLKSTPGFDRFDQKEQQRAIKDAAGRARSFIQQVEGRGAIRDADPAVKINIMQRLLQEIPSNE